MAKISIYLDDERLKELDNLVENSPYLVKLNRSSLFNYLIEQEAIKQRRQKMLEAAKAADQLNLGWSVEEENCAIIDAKVSG